MIAYKMGLDSDEAEKLFDEVGEELTLAVLERVKKKFAYHDSLPAHGAKHPIGWFWGVEAQNCRVEFRAKQKRERLVSERGQSTQKVHKDYAKGFRPTLNTLYGKLEDVVQKDEKDGGITYEQFQIAKRFLDELDEEEELCQTISAKS